MPLAPLFIVSACHNSCFLSDWMITGDLNKLQKKLEWHVLFPARSGFMQMNKVLYMNKIYLLSILLFMLPIYPFYLAEWRHGAADHKGNLPLGLKKRWKRLQFLRRRNVSSAMPGCGIEKGAKEHNLQNSVLL